MRRETKVLLWGVSLALLGAVAFGALVYVNVGGVVCDPTHMDCSSRTAADQVRQMAFDAAKAVMAVGVVLVGAAIVLAVYRVIKPAAGNGRKGSKGEL